MKNLKEPMDEVWLYNALVEMVKKSGQGIPCKLFAMKVPSFYTLVEKLESKGLVKCVVEHNSYLPDDEWLCLTQGYCVEQDNQDNYGRQLCLNALTFIRYYRYHADNIDDPIVPKFPSIREIIEANIGEYAEWLTRNAIALVETDFIPHIEREVVDAELFDWIKTRSWYKDNKSLSDALTSSEEARGKYNDDMFIGRKIEGLYKEWSRLGDLAEDKKKEREENLKYMENLKRTPVYRDKFKYLVQSCEDKGVKMQEFISSLEVQKEPFTE